MIKAYELRIGSKFLGAGMIQTVKEILDYGPNGSIQQRGNSCVAVSEGYSHLILVKENGNQYKPVDMEPLPITVALLLKYGFEKCSCDGFKKGTFHLYGGFRYERGVPKIKGFHKLQNLYLAHTQTEL